jgi:hypothetical protein
MKMSKKNKFVKEILSTLKKHAMYNTFYGKKKKNYKTIEEKSKLLLPNDLVTDLVVELPLNHNIASEAELKTLCYEHFFQESFQIAIKNLPVQSVTKDSFKEMVEAADKNIKILLSCENKFIIENDVNFVPIVEGKNQIRSNYFGQGVEKIGLIHNKEVWVDPYLLSDMCCLIESKFADFSVRVNEEETDEFETFFYTKVVLNNTSSNMLFVTDYKK